MLFNHDPYFTHIPQPVVTTDWGISLTFDL